MFDLRRFGPRLMPGSVCRAAVTRIAQFAVPGFIFASLLLAACGEQKPETPSAILDIRSGAALVKFSPDSEFIPAARGEELFQGYAVRSGTSAQVAVIFFDGSVSA